MFIYLLLNVINGKYYIGKWRGHSVADRIRMHVREAARGSKTRIHNAIRKNGIDNFKLHVIYQAQDASELAECERYFISLFKSCDREIGYNITTGGEGASYPRSPETCARMSAGRMRLLAANQTLRSSLIAHCKEIARQKVGWKHSAETRQQLSVSYRKRTPKGNGIIFTPEIRQRMRESRAKFFASPEGIAQRERLSRNKGNGNLRRTA
jgi:group I intron endonuclease